MRIQGATDRSRTVASRGEPISAGAISGFRNLKTVNGLGRILNRSSMDGAGPICATNRCAAAASSSSACVIGPAGQADVASIANGC
eukprot:COSAG05_NODE_92_length_19835_cov_158.918271_7_plen_86_part_00